MNNSIMATLFSLVSIISPLLVLIGSIYYISKKVGADSILLLIGSGIGFLINAFYILTPYLISRNNMPASKVTQLYPIVGIVSFFQVFSLLWGSLSSFITPLPNKIVSGINFLLIKIETLNAELKTWENTISEIRNFICFALHIFLLLLASCSPRPNIQGKGEAFMQGVWNEDSVAFSNKLSNYTQHHFKFTCDSVYIDLVTHSKINFYEDSCYNKGIWKEYAKGVYAVKGDTLFIGATFTHANYKQKISGCYRIGRYDKNFLIKKKAADTLVLESLSDQREITLSLKEKVTCVQKEL